MTGYWGNSPLRLIWMVTTGNEAATAAGLTVRDQ